MSVSRRPSPLGARGGLLHRHGRAEPKATAPHMTVEPGLKRLHRRKAFWLIFAAVVLIGTGVAGELTGSPFPGGTSGAGAAGNAGPTGLSTVTRQSLSSQTELPATLGYADSYSVVNQAQGTITS